MEYPKIETLFDRDPDTFKVDINRLRMPEVALIKEWLVTEKIDGMNVRVAFYTGPAECDGPPGAEGDTVASMIVATPTVEFYGRTERAQLPQHLFSYLCETFTAEKLQAVFDPDTSGILYGEGYGEKIQGGGKYRKGVAFRLFDVVIFGHTGRPWWLEWENVEGIASKLGIDTVPVLGTFELGLDLPSVVAEGFDSVVARMDRPSELDPVVRSPDQPHAEGIVARTRPLLFCRNGARLMWKLKTRDF